MQELVFAVKMFWQRNKRVIVRIALGVLAVALYVLIALAVPGPSFVMGSSAGIYWIEVYRAWVILPIMMLAFLGAALWLAAMTPDFLVKRRLNLAQRLGSAAVFVLVCLVPLWCTVGAPGSGSLAHLKTLHMGEHVYYLADHQTSSFAAIEGCSNNIDPACQPGEVLETHEIALFQCDAQGIMCWLVCETQEHFPHPPADALMAGVYDGSIQVIAQGAVACSYHHQ